VGLDKVVLDSLPFRELGLHGLPSPLDFDPLAERAVQPLDAVVVGVWLSDSNAGDLFGPVLEVRLIPLMYRDAPSVRTVGRARAPIDRGREEVAPSKRVAREPSGDYGVQGTDIIPGVCL